MPNCYLENYNLSFPEILQSLVISEYGLRHMTLANSQNQYKWGHRTIALLEFCPIVGIVATAIEALIGKQFKKSVSLSQPISQTLSVKPLPVMSFSSSILPQNPPIPPPPQPMPIFQEWLFKGSQANGTGKVLTSKAEAIRVSLDSCGVAGIHFNKDKISDFIEGGTCSAMSLEFLNSYFKIRKECSILPEQRSEILLERVKQLGNFFASSSEEMRNRQTAYNTIEVDKLDPEIDYSKNKIQALANYHFLNIDHCSKEIDVSTLTNENELEPEIEALPHGAFLLRILEAADNEKLETHGHSLVYIKEQDLGLFYDPNYGVRNLTSSGHSKVLFNGFQDCFQTFKINKARFYRLQPQESEAQFV